jgi:hypothetical protein
MWADTHRAREVLGFVPKVSLREGLAQEVAWLRSQSDGAFSDTASRLVPLWQSSRTPQSRDGGTGAGNGVLRGIDWFTGQPRCCAILFSSAERRSSHGHVPAANRD